MTRPTGAGHKLTGAIPRQEETMHSLEIINALNDKEQRQHDTRQQLRAWGRRLAARPAPTCYLCGDAEVYSQDELCPTCDEYASWENE